MKISMLLSVALNFKEKMPSRRRCLFLVPLHLVTLLILLTSGCSSAEENYDLVIRGGLVVDGTGSPRYIADIGIRGDTIKSVGDLSAARSLKVLDVQGLVVSPGFIDMHSHSDFSLLVDGRALSKITQGVTTELIGESESAAPVLGATIPEREKVLSGLGLSLDWASLAQYFDRIERQGVSVNIVSTVGLGQVRASVMGYEDRPAKEGELQRMKELVEQSMQEGAAGLSSGLIYNVDRNASTKEIISLARVAARHGGIYLTHIRGEDGRLLIALQEAIEIGRRAKIPVEILHFKRAYLPLDREPYVSIQKAAALIERAQKEGVSVNANLYPYAASQTRLDTRLPDWVHEGGREKLLSRIRDSRIGARVLKEVSTELAKGIAGKTPDSILFAATPYKLHQMFQGMRISEIARKLKVSPGEAIIELVNRSDGLAMASFFGMREQDVRYALVLPWTTIGSDGTAVDPESPFFRSHPHPRWYGTFPRILGFYVREEKILDLEEAIRKMTGLSAMRLGLHDRGIIAVGKKADLAIFNPQTIIDRSTFKNPQQLSQGIEYVVVNGELVLEMGRHTGALPGRVLKHRGP